MLAVMKNATSSGAQVGVSAIRMAMRKQDARATM